VVNSTTFIDVIQWWDARKTVLPAHYKMACDFLGIPATSTPCERANSAAGREFTSVRQSLSTTVFIKSMLLRSWMAAGTFSFPRNREQAAADLTKLSSEKGDDIASAVDVIDCDEVEWDGELVDDSVAGILNATYDKVESDSLM
jgi:hAT family C-terminal dimerisation region